MSRLFLTHTPDDPDWTRFCSAFQNEDERITPRAYHRHLNEKPQDGEQLPHALIDGFSNVSSSDGAWNSVQDISQGMEHTANLQLPDEFWPTHIYGDDTEHERTSTVPNTPLVQIEHTGMGIERIWLINMRQAIQNYKSNGITICELRTILATNTPYGHIQTVCNSLHALAGCVNKEVLDGLLEKLQVEEGFATDGGLIN
jgi:hypothetical protein